MTKRIYNSDLLNEFIAKDMPISVDVPEKITSKIKIKFICKCRNPGFLSFRAIVENDGILCNKCKQKRRIRTIQENTMRKYGKIHSFQVNDIKEKITKTNLIKYGVKNVFESEFIKEKIKQTNLQKFGVEYATKNPNIKEKISESHLSLDKHIPNKKREETNMNKYGVRFSSQSEQVKQKAKETNLEKYGVENVMHIPEFVEKQFKNSFRYKSYTFPSGKKVLIQGYENFALDKLLQSYQEEEIIVGVSLVPKIFYQDNQKLHRYYPDIFIPKDNLIIEVKSTYTHQKDLRVNDLKRNKCLELGYRFEFWTFDQKGFIESINTNLSKIK